ncbi:MAG: ZIP family metal transporter [Oscillospiraceae bacterium]|nr:ZIP family metal transporter [Oscillospiraceae bacterium]MDY4397199.1 ZIP family metal transporter [Oscillospiraceae bacterium]MDY5017391.1 ZIP family metal transporter [Oscillospiraceae bacterium]
MLRPLMLALLGTSFTFLMTALGAATVFFFARAVCERAQGALLGFAAGVMTAASVWSLILPAIEQTAAEGRLPPFLPAAAGIVLGALLLALLDEFTRQRGGERVTHSDFLLLSAITLHNIPEGMAVGLAFALAADGEGLAGAAALALGIGVQNFPEGAAVALPLYQSGQSKLRAFVTGVLSGAVEPLFGVLVVLAAARVHALMPWLLSFAAGAMLYVVAEELLPRAGSRRGTCGFLVGFLFMMVLDVALG